MTVIVTIRGIFPGVQEEIPAPDFRSACRYLRKHGLMTYDQKGEVWYPPQMIEIVRPKYE